MDETSPLARLQAASLTDWKAQAEAMLDLFDAMDHRPTAVTLLAGRLERAFNNGCSHGMEMMLDKRGARS
jgi:hypothetical protein